MNKNNNKTILIGLVISLSFFLIFIFTKDIKQEVLSPSNISLSETKKFETEKIPKEQEKTTKAFLEIENTKYESEISEEISVYDFMAKLQNEGKIYFKEKTYSGMGKLIEEINGIKNSGEKNWIYYVNNKKAEIGISNYKINIGDVVSWKYESNIY